MPLTASGCCRNFCAAASGTLSQLNPDIDVPRARQRSFRYGGRVETMFGCTMLNVHISPALTHLLPVVQPRIQVVPQRSLVWDHRVTWVVQRAMNL
jgi:hypothetical protein